MHAELSSHHLMAPGFRDIADWHDRSFQVREMVYVGPGPQMMIKCNFAWGFAFYVWTIQRHQIKDYPRGTPSGPSLALAHLFVFSSVFVFVVAVVATLVVIPAPSSRSKNRKIQGSDPQPIPISEGRNALDEGNSLKFSTRGFL